MRLRKKRPRNKPRVTWKDVLLAIYNERSMEIEFGKGGITGKHPLAKKLGISGKELRDLLKPLEKQDLIKRFTIDEKIQFPLTEKGFNVAVKIEGSRETSAYRLVSIFFSAILALTLLMALLYQMYPNVPSWTLIGLYIIVLIIWFVTLKKSINRGLRAYG